MAGWFDLPRVPEPEVMDDSGEVEAYSSSAAQAYLGQIDDTFVAHALHLLSAPGAIAKVGTALDIGTGPGQIVHKLSQLLPGWTLIGVDRSPSMIREAIAGSNSEADFAPAANPNLGNSGVGAVFDGAPNPQVKFLLADGNRLPFADASFGLVMCNSVLHHLARPQLLFAEMARVSRPSGAILIRDLRRPSRLTSGMHVRWYGRHYTGLMYKLYGDSVRAAYTSEELGAMLRASPISRAQVFTRGRTHIGIARKAQPASDQRPSAQR